MTARPCLHCRQPKPAADYARQPNGRDGLRGACRACTTAYFREWRARRVEAHARWLAERGLAARSPGTVTKRLDVTLAAVWVGRGA